MNRWISNIIWWWQRRHNRLASLPEWKRADHAHRDALARGCTQAVHRATQDKRNAIHSALSGRPMGRA
jgi:hypothetical protein